MGRKLKAFGVVLRKPFRPGDFFSGLLKRAAGLPQNVQAAIHAFEHGLTEEEAKDPAYRISYGFVPLVGKKAGAADVAVQIVAPGSPEAADIEKIILKEVNRERYPPAKVVERVQCAGFPKFTIQDHTRLWEERDAKNLARGELARFV